MMPLIESVRDLVRDEHKILGRPYGMIEVAKGNLVRVQLKPWPKIGSIVESKWISPWKNRRRPHDICRIYYNQPAQHRNFLALTFVEATPNTSLATIVKSLQTLDRIAYIKRSDAIVAEVSNQRINDRSLQRFGWERYRLDSSKRHWIKRFYDVYPEHVKVNDLAGELTASNCR